MRVSVSVAIGCIVLWIAMLGLVVQHQHADASPMPVFQPREPDPHPLLLEEVTRCRCSHMLDAFEACSNAFPEPPALHYPEEWRCWRFLDLYERCAGGDVQEDSKDVGGQRSTLPSRYAISS